MRTRAPSVLGQGVWTTDLSVLGQGVRTTDLSVLGQGVWTTDLSVLGQGVWTTDLLPGEGDLDVGVDEDPAVGGLGEAGQDPGLHGGQTLGPVDPHGEPRPRPLRTQTLREQQVPEDHRRPGP